MIRTFMPPLQLNTHATKTIKQQKKNQKQNDNNNIIIIMSIGIAIFKAVDFIIYSRLQ